MYLGKQLLKYNGLVHVTYTQLENIENKIKFVDFFVEN